MCGVLFGLLYRFLCTGTRGQNLHMARRQQRFYQKAIPGDLRLVKRLNILLHMAISHVKQEYFVALKHELHVSSWFEVASFTRQDAIFLLFAQAFL